MNTYTTVPNGAATAAPAFVPPSTRQLANDLLLVADANHNDLRRLANGEDVDAAHFLTWAYDLLGLGLDLTA